MSNGKSLKVRCAMAKPRCPECKKPISTAKKAFEDASRAHQIYRNAEGEVVPGVTTVLREIQEAEFLIKAAHREGLLGVEWDEYCRQAAQVGTLVHSMIESYYKGAAGEPVDLQDYTPRQVQIAENAWTSFAKWADENKFEPLFIEIQMASKEFGGTADIIGHMAGQLYVADIKTGDDIYESQEVQIEAYARLFEEYAEAHPELQLDVSNLKTAILKPAREKDGKCRFIPYERDPYAWHLFCLALDVRKTRQARRAR